MLGMAKPSARGRSHASPPLRTSRYSKTSFVSRKVKLLISGLSHCQRMAITAGVSSNACCSSRGCSAAGSLVSLQPASARAAASAAAVIPNFAMSLPSSPRSSGLELLRQPDLLARREIAVEAEAQADRHLDRGDRALVDLQSVEQQQVAAVLVETVADLH